MSYHIIILRQKNIIYREENKKICPRELIKTWIIIIGISATSEPKVLTVYLFVQIRSIIQVK